MKKLVLLIIIFGFAGQSWGQENDPKTYLKKQSDAFIILNDSLKMENKILENIKAKINDSNTDPKILTELATQLHKTTKLKSRLDSVYTVAQTAISFYITNRQLTKDEAKAIFSHDYEVVKKSNTDQNSEPQNTSITIDTFRDFAKKVLKENEDNKTKIGVVQLQKEALVFSTELWNLYKKNTDVKKNIGKTSFFNRWIGIETRRTNFDKILMEYRNADFDKEKRINTYHFNNSVKKEIKDSMEIKMNRRDVFQAIFVDIESVKLDINEGMIEYIKVFLKDGSIFYNKSAPISIVHLEDRGNDRLYNNDGDQFIYLKNVIAFDYDKRFGFLPDDGEFSITEKEKIKILHKNTNVNNLINFTAYTDLMGLLGNEPNSLISFEANAKFYLHRKNIRNSFVYILPSIQPHFYYNKLDSKFDKIDITDITKINSSEIFRRNNYSVSLDLCVLRYDWKPSNSIELKAGYIYTSSKVSFDSARLTQLINHIKFGGINLKSKLINNFGIETFVRYMWQRMNDNDDLIKLVDDDGNSLYKKYSNMMAFRGGVYYAPPKGDGKDKIFLRFTNYIVFGDRKSDFSQIQVGFTKALDF